ncbi:hypothetical protein POM88_013372 [Heracleum sosnowskyi]|uniref:RRM domain-containing protein n=1 Tax=Heracleum sosnowskyi TaxID=360622 RepID=A0AAD8J0W7_9APIA|nr:hypothetical protein POM88_013372 [Heracleum sosnowskyi]
MWTFFKLGGNIIDIIFPRRRDRWNNCIGFVKTSSELEARKIISNLKQYKGLGRVLRMSINHRNYDENSKVQGGMATGVRTDGMGILNKDSKRIKEIQVSNHVVHNRNVFEFLETEIDGDIEDSFMNSVVGFTRIDVKVSYLLDMLHSEGLMDIRIVKAGSFIYYFNKVNNLIWEGKKREVLEKYFVKVRKSQEKDLIIPRMVEVECISLPVSAWLEENLKAYSKFVGEWISWSYQNEKDLEIFNPRVRCVTHIKDEIKEKMKITVKGKLYEVVFQERKEADSVGMIGLKDSISYVECTLHTKEQERIMLQNANSLEAGSITDKGNIGEGLLPDIRCMAKDGTREEGSIYSFISASNKQNSVSSLSHDIVVPETVIEINGEDQHFLSESMVLEEGNLDELGKWKHGGSYETNINNLSDSDITRDSDQLEDELVGSRVEFGRESHSILCENLTKINMGKNRGRPKKKNKTFVNSFDFKLGGRLGGRNAGIKRNVKNIHTFGGASLVSKDHSILNINSKNIHNLEVEVALIMDAAIGMRLEIPGDSQQNECVCFIRDFNRIRDDSERANCSYRRIDMKGFNQFIDNSNFLELALVNSEFTWFGPGCKKSKLDRALVNSMWWSKRQWILRTSSRKSSDHRVLWLSYQIYNWGHVPFKIYNCWLKDKELMKLIDSQACKDVQSGNMNLTEILRRARLSIKDWSKLEKIG